MKAHSRDDIERAAEAVICIRSVIDMVFCENGYGSPDDSMALSMKIAEQLANEGRLS